MVREWYLHSGIARHCTQPQSLDVRSLLRLLLTLFVSPLCRYFFRLIFRLHHSSLHKLHHSSLHKLHLSRYLRPLNKLHLIQLHKLHHRSLHKLHHRSLHKLHHRPLHNLHHRSLNKLHLRPLHKLHLRPLHKLHPRPLHKLHVRKPSYSPIVVHNVWLSLGFEWHAIPPGVCAKHCGPLYLGIYTIESSNTYAVVHAFNTKVLSE